MILKTDRVAALLKNTGGNDPLVITPTPELAELEESGAGAVDLRLGTWFVTLRSARMEALRFGSPDSPSPSPRQLTKLHYVRFGAEYVLHPQAFVLGVTLEWLRFPGNLAGYVVGKSGLGRCGLIIATATGVHPGFKGCLTLELTNVGEIPISIRPGMSVCQVFFHSVDAVNPTLSDRSRFVGLRRPVPGELKLDRIALRLSRPDA
jgi:dCTP deaminase